MRRRVSAAVVLLIAVFVGGLAISGIRAVRTAALRTECVNNLKSIGFAVQGCHETYKRFPPAVVPSGALPPQDRLGWLVYIWPAYMAGGMNIRFDKTKPWDAPENCPPPCVVRRHSDTGELQFDDEALGEVAVFLCPANPARIDPSLPCVTHYVGIAGVGADAAELPLSDPRAGFFGYDRKLSVDDVKDGLATTLMAAEVLEGGPWTAGGPATVRGLSANMPYLGNGGQFASQHEMTNVLFADVSVRWFTDSISPRVFEALATVAGNEAVELP